MKLEANVIESSIC